MSKPVCYMGIYNEHDIRDMHTVVVRYVTDFKSNPDRVIPLYEHPPVPTTERRVIPEDAELLAFAADEQFFLFCEELEVLDIMRTTLQKYLNAAPAKGEEG